MAKDTPVPSVHPTYSRELLERTENDERPKLIGVTKPRIRREVRPQIVLGELGEQRLERE